jgi:tRNA 5-methylaminomethyl-2-thiouridine biosynthesis bifunctional protein
VTPPTNASTALRTVLSFGSYITPAHRGAHYIGATFDATDAAQGKNDIQADTEDDVRNIEAINRILPEMLHDGRTISPHHRAAIRCTSPDHLPISGPVPDQGAYLKDFAEMRHGHPWTSYPDAAYQAGLYVLTALGSRGMTSAPLAAEVLVAHITGEPWPLERDLMTALHPARFLMRNLKRREV